MPADKLIVPLRPGHIDTVSDVVPAGVAASVETRQMQGAEVAILHLDVATGDTVDQPFSVGIPLLPGDVVALIAALTSASEVIDRQAQGDWLN